MKQKTILLFLFSLIGLTLSQIPFGEATPIYENYTTYTELDPNNRIDFNSTNINHTAYMNEKARLTYDYGAGSFRNFEHNVSANWFNYSVGGAGFRASSIWVSSNTLDDSNYLINNVDSMILNFERKSNGVLTVRLRARSGATKYVDIYESPTLDTWYYFTINRTSTTLTAQIFNNSARSSLIDTLTVTCPSTNFRYIYGCNTWHSNSASYVHIFISHLSLGNKFSVTFQHYTGGIFRVDNATTLNGTSIIYFNGSTVELASLPQNSSYNFLNFTWNGNNATTNPYNLTITQELTVWCYFSEIEEGGYTGFVFMFFGLIVGLIVGVLVGYGSKQH